MQIEGNIHNIGYYLFLFCCYISMTSFLKTAGSVLLTLLIAAIGYEAYHAYMINHTYYYDILTTADNWKIIIRFIIIWTIPAFFLFWKKKFSLSSRWRSLLWILIVSGYIHSAYKWGLVGSTGLLIYLFNMIILLAIVVIFFGGIYTIGYQLYRLWFKQPLRSLTDILLAGGMGLGAFLLINYILLLVHLFYPIMAWIQFIGLGYSIWYGKKTIFAETKIIINNFFSTINNLPTNWKIIYTILMVVTMIYIFFGFNLSYIPYSTAWDANHAYMYFPKVRSLHNGIFFSEGPVTYPFLRMGYIAYWFSLFKPLASWFTIAPDTLAVFMNSISGWLSLIFWLGALHQVILFIDKRLNTLNDSYHITFWMGWMYLLLWLMSGMGAFLVFVDNKTDLGVMSLTMLALMSWFIFIEHTQVSEPTSSPSRHTPTHLYAILSGVFFSLAVMTKPTAFQDVLIFGLLLVGLWIGIYGLVGWFLLVLGILGRAETMSIVFYISKSFANKLGIIWWIGAITQAVLTRKKKVFWRVRPMVYWAVAIIIMLVIFKGAYLLPQQIISNSLNAKTFINGILLGQSSSPSNKLHSALVADSGNTINPSTLSWSFTTTTAPSIKPAACSLTSAGLNADNLYANLGAIQWGWLIEDLGRYIGFGQRTFTDPSTRPSNEKNNYGFVRLGYYMLKAFFHTPGCYSFNTTADTLCEQPALANSAQGVSSLMTQTSSDSNQYKFLSGVLTQYQSINTEVDTGKQQNIMKDIQKAINDYVAGNTIHVTEGKNNTTSIAVPYAYLTPLNVIFNRSLQNLSSYYTDIWFIWVVSLVLLIAGLIYAIIKQEKKLILLHIVTLFWWIIRWFIASGIIWYAVGIIAWTLFCNAIYLERIYNNNRTETISWSGKMLFSIVIITALIQTGLNMFRIASQWGSGPFTWYKWYTGKENVFVFSNQGIQQKETIDYNYTAQDVFDLQFGHYNHFLNAVKNRNDDDGILIAGTYIQYFLANQNNITSDGLLGTFRQRGSDENSCNLALRLKDKKIKYLVIDPNIWSVVMGEGNSTLFDRFLAKIDTKTNKIIQQGTISMIAKMIQEWYLKLMMTNNMGAKYAYTLSDTELQSAIASLPYEEVKTKLWQAFMSDPLLFRSKLAVPRYFWSESQDYFILIGAIFQQRLSSPQGSGMEDIADIIGKDIKLSTLLPAIQQFSTGNGTNLNKTLSNDEKTVIGYYSAITGKLKANDTQGAQEIIQQLLQSSLWGGSQLMTFELQI